MPTTLLKLIYSEKATKFCEISTIDLSYVVSAMVEISQNFVAFSENMNFIHISQINVNIATVSHIMLYVIYIIKWR